MASPSEDPASDLQTNTLLPGIEPTAECVWHKMTILQKRWAFLLEKLLFILGNKTWPRINSACVSRRSLLKSGLLLQVKLDL